MPYRRSFRRSRPAARYKRKYTRYARRTPMRRRPTSMRRRYKRVYRKSRASKMSRPISSNRLMVKLPYYVDYVLHNSATSSATYQEALFNLNSIYDPEAATGGHQPRGYDQYQSLYNKYLVHGVSYIIGFYPTSITALSDIAGRGLCGIRCFASGEENAFSDITACMEQPKEHGGKWKRWTRTQTTGPYDSNSDRPVFFKGYVSIKKLAATRYPELIWPKDFISPVGQNPSNILTMMLWAGSQSLATGTSSALETNNLPTMLVDMKLQFYTSFLDAAYIAAS